MKKIGMSLCILATSGLWAAPYNVEPKRATGTLRIMTFNVRRITGDDKGKDSWRERLPLIIQMIKDFNPDIIGFQEPIGIATIALKDRLGSTYDWLGESRGFLCRNEPKILTRLHCTAQEKACKTGFIPSCDGEFAPIFYKKKVVTPTSSGTFWLNDGMKKLKVGWDAKDLRICTWASFKVVGSDKTLVIANTHLDNEGKQARVKGAQLIADFLKGKTNFAQPAIIMGDFNDPVGVFAPLFAKYGLRNSREVAREKTGLARIDLLFTNPLIEVVRYGVVARTDNKPLSDHRPVFIDIKLK